MSHWKVILAALVIFAAGLFAGGVGSRLVSKTRPVKRQPVEQPNLPIIVSEKFVERMAKDVALTPEQREHIAQTVCAGQARIREIYSLVGPEVSEELHYVRESIRAELTPEQQKRFDEFMRKQRQRRLGEAAHPEGQRSRPPGAGSPERDGRRPPLRALPPGASNNPMPRVPERRSKMAPGFTNPAPPKSLDSQAP